MAEYRTRQGQAVLELFEQNKERHFTAEEAAAALKDHVGRATVYRQLERLVRDGEIRKYSLGKGESCCYKRAAGAECDTHYHLICLRCKKLIHLDCSLMAKLDAHVLDAHDFRLDPSRTVLYGVCGECR